MQSLQLWAGARNGVKITRVALLSRCFFKHSILIHTSTLIMSLWVQEDIYIWNNEVFHLDYQTLYYFNLICVYED